MRFHRPDYRLDDANDAVLGTDFAGFCAQMGSTGRYACADCGAHGPKSGSCSVCNSADLRPVLIAA